MAVKSRTFTWHLESPPEKLWPILGHTARLNEAARLEGETIGGDIIVSAEFCEDAAVQKLVEDFTPVAQTPELKGFEGPVAFYRISAEELATKRN